MKPISSRSALVTACLTILCTSPSDTLAFAVTGSHGRSTYLAVQQWASEVGYAVVWQPQTRNGIADFVALPRDIHEDFRIAVEALVSGAAYGRANIYCIPPMELQAEAIIDDRMRLVYVVGRPTGRRCVVQYP